MTMMKLALSTAVALTLGTAAMADNLAWTATLDQAQQTKMMVPVPGAMGTAKGTLDTGTGELTWQVEFTGLSGGVTAAHFHGPAAPGADAAVVQDINETSGPVSPMTGHAKLVNSQMTELEDGLWYINIHTVANPDGEIRGQVIFTK